MNNSINKDKWVYIMVQDPGADEKIAGLHDKEEDISFIPAFYDKEEAEKCIINIPREAGRRYELQAIIYEDLADYAKENRFEIFFLNKEGKIQKKINP